MKEPGRRALAPFGVSVFTEYTELAVRHGAINLSQGFPDFDGPPSIVAAATEAMRAGHNQYAPSHGIAPLRHAVAAKARRHQGLAPDPETEVTVFSGATEALFSSCAGLLEPNDEVIVFEPCYDAYRPDVAMAGARAVPVALDADTFRLDPDALDAAFTPRTRMVILNTPMNPTGKVFDDDELAAIAARVREHDALLLCDEVYEHITYGAHRHRSAAALDGMWERTVTISSTAKTFSMTGWKVGYAVAPAPLSRAIRMAHQFVTFCTATPLQHAMAAALEEAERSGYYDTLRRSYDARRRLLLGHLEAAGFDVLAPEGTYYAIADIRPLGLDDDAAFCRLLPAETGVAAIPVSAFYGGGRGPRTRVRFAFCKRRALLDEAGQRLRAGTRRLA